MADLGTLYYGVRLKDLTDEDKDRIRKKLEGMGVELGVKIDASKIQTRIDEVSKGKGYNIKVGLDLDKSKIQDFVNTMNSSGLSASGARMARAINNSMRTEAYVKAQNAAEKSRESLAKLREERLRNIQAESNQKNSTERLNQSFTHQSRIVSELRGQIRDMFSVYAAERFIKSLYTIGGEFQKQKIALTSILQSGEKANKIFGQIKTLAIKSPFEFKELTSYTKQLAAFSIPYEELYDTTKRLADISAGLGVDMGRIILAYGQVRSAAFLRGQEVRQFTEAGIPLLDALAKKFEELEGRAVSASEVFDKISKREVSFGMVKDVLFGMTDKGGQFYNLQEKLAESLAGKWSNLKDAWDVMMADIAEDNNSVLGGSLDLLTSIMEHWRTILDFIAPVVAGYGSLKVAIMAINAYDKASASINSVQILINRARAIKGLTAATKAQTLAQYALNAAQKASPYIALATVIAGLTYGIYKWITAESAAEKATRRHREELERVRDLLDERKQEAERLIEVIQSETATDFDRVEAYERLKHLYPSITNAMSMQEVAAMNLTEAIRMMNEENNDAKYESLVKDLNKYTTAMNILRNKLTSEWTNEESSLIRSIFGTGSIDRVYLQKQINLAKESLEEYERIKKKAEFDAKPIDVKLFELNKERDSLHQELLAAEMELNQFKGKFETIPLTVQLRYDNAKAAFDKVEESINKLQSSVSGNETYSDAFSKAQKAYLKAKANLEKAKKGTKAEYLTALEEFKKAEEDYKNIGGLTGTKQENEAKKRKELQEKLAEELLSLGRQNQQDEINLLEEGTDKKLKQINIDFKKQEDAIRKKAESLKKANKESGAVGLNVSGLTAKQQSEIDKANRLNVESRKKAENEIYKAEADAMRNYLKEYGTFQQQKLAIAEEYAEKIKKAQNEGERLSLERQRDSAIQQVEVNAIKQSVDWGSVFGEFGAIFKEQLQPTIDKLKAIVKSDEFKSSNLQDQQTLYELIQKLEQSNAAWDSDIFKRVSDDLIKYQSAMQQYIVAQEREKEATEALAKAKRELANAEKSGNNADALKAQVAVTEAEISLSTASDDVRRFGIQVQDSTNQLQSSSEKAKNMFLGLESSLNNLVSGSLKGMGQGLMQLDALFNNSEITKVVGNSLAEGFQSLLGKDSKASKAITEALGSTGMAGEIISAILGILDVIAQNGISGIITGLQDTIYGAVEKILEDVFSGDIVTKPIENSFRHIDKILNTISFGGFHSLKRHMFGGNGKEVQEAINQLTDRNEMLQTAIENLTDVMKSSKGTKSVAAYNEAYKLQKETIDNYKNIAKEQARYSGSHRSWNYYWGGFSQEQINRLSSQIGRSWNGDIWNLSPEEMKMLRSNVDMWKQIQDTGKGGYGSRLTEKLDAYIDQAGTLEEITNALYEGLTGMSFDSMYNSFVDNLMDMKYDAKAAAEDISEYFMRAMLSNKIGEMYSDKLEEWWNKFGASMEDNELTEAERKALQDEYMGYVEEAIKLRNELANATGYNPSSNSKSSGLSKGIQGVTEETSDLLASYINAIRADVSVNREYLRVLVEDSFPSFSLIAEAQLQQLGVIADNTGKNVAIVEEIRDILNGARIGKDRGFWVR